MMEKAQAYIDIDIQNKEDILRCILDTIPYMDGWYADTNASNFHIVTNCPRYFRFFFQEKKFTWLCGDEGPTAGTLTLDPIVISDMAQISELLEFVNHAASQLADSKTAADNLHDAFAKLFCSPKEAPRKVPTPKSKNFPSLMDIVAIQPMAQPSGKVFYMDYVYGTGSKPQPYPEMAKAIQKAADMVAKSNTAFVTATQYAKQKKLHEDMAKDVQEEIDKEILDKMASVLGAPKKEEKIKKWESETLGSWDDGVVVDPPYGLSMSGELKEKHKKAIAQAKEYVSKLTTVAGCNKALEPLLGMHDPLNEMLRKMILKKLHDIKDSMEILAANAKAEKQHYTYANKHHYTYTDWNTGVVIAPAYPKWET